MKLKEILKNYLEFKEAKETEQWYTAWDSENIRLHAENPEWI
jgi:hypothetical protein